MVLVRRGTWLSSSAATLRPADPRLLAGSGLPRGGSSARRLDVGAGTYGTAASEARRACASTSSAATTFR